MKLKQIKTQRPRLADEVYNQLLEAINNGDISEDERLVQEKLALEMEISRTPVREALLRLEQDGILRVAKRGGFVIRTMSEDEIREIYQVRVAIEGQAARMLALKNDATEFTALREFIIKQEDISSPTVKAFFTANRNIHRRIVELSDNSYLIDIFDNIWSRASSYKLFAAIEKVDLSESLGEHMVLLDAIATGNPATAMEAMAVHIEDGLDLQIRAISKG